MYDERLNENETTGTADAKRFLTTRPLWRVSSAHAISTAPLKPDWGFIKAYLSLKAALITLYVKLLSPAN